MNKPVVHMTLWPMDQTYQTHWAVLVLDVEMFVVRGLACFFILVIRILNNYPLTF